MKRKTRKVQIGRTLEGDYEIAEEDAVWRDSWYGFENGVLVGLHELDWSGLGLKAIRKGRHTTGRIVPLANGVRIEVEPKP